MAVTAHVGWDSPRTPRWLVSLRWALRGAGGLACAAAMLASPELISSLLRDGAPLKAIAVESLHAYRTLAATAGISMLVLAEFLPRLALHPEVLLGTIGEIPALVLLAACVALKAAFGPEHMAYLSLVREDSITEYATSAAYLGAACVAAIVARGLRRRREQPLAVLWIGLTIALVLVSLEEISWGQRLFGVQTPELLASNVQAEMNLHNLPWIQRGLHGAYIAVGLFGSFAWALIPNSGSARLKEIASWMLPSRALLAYFLPVAVFYSIWSFTPLRWIGPGNLRFGFVSSYDQEPAEFLLSLGFLLFTLHGLARLHRRPRAGGSQSAR